MCKQHKKPLSPISFIGRQDSGSQILPPPSFSGRANAVVSTHTHAPRHIHSLFCSSPFFLCYALFVHVHQRRQLWKLRQLRVRVLGVGKSKKSSACVCLLLWGSMLLMLLVKRFSFPFCPLFFCALLVLLCLAITTIHLTHIKPRRLHL